MLRGRFLPLACSVSHKLGFVGTAVRREAQKSTIHLIPLLLTRVGVKSYHPKPHFHSLPLHSSYPIKRPFHVDMRANDSSHREEHARAKIPSIRHLQAEIRPKQGVPSRVILEYLYAILVPTLPTVRFSKFLHFLIALTEHIPEHPGVCIYPFSIKSNTNKRLSIKSQPIEKNPSLLLSRALEVLTQERRPLE